MLTGKMQCANSLHDNCMLPPHTSLHQHPTCHFPPIFPPSIPPSIYTCPLPQCPIIPVCPCIFPCPQSHCATIPLICPSSMASPLCLHPAHAPCMSFRSSFPQMPPVPTCSMPMMGSPLRDSSIPAARVTCTTRCFQLAAPPRAATDSAAAAAAVRLASAT